MAIDEPTKIDAIGIDKVTEEVVLTISDHLSWTEDFLAHVYLLEAKLNAYLNFAGGTQIVEALPKSVGRKRRIDLVHKFEPTPKAFQVLEGIKVDMATHGVAFRFHALPRGY